MLVRLDFNLIERYFMAPLPKRKHSTARKGKRRVAVALKVAKKLAHTKTFLRK
mgnify:CR=1 FL=1